MKIKYAEPTQCCNKTPFAFHHGPSADLVDSALHWTSLPDVGLFQGFEVCLLPGVHQGGDVR